MVPPMPLRPALFLDVDGTLLGIRSRPEEVRADAALCALLERVRDRTDGALALVSGRTVDDLDRVFAPLTLPVAGLHGLERRDASGITTRADFDRAPLRAAAKHLRAFVAATPPLWLEDKGGALAVHCRDAPELEALVDREMHALADRSHGAFHVQRGLFVRELKPGSADKGTAIRAFMQEAPYRGRVPVAIGDDITDLDMFRVARDLGGFGIAIGTRVDAEWRLADADALNEWLIAASL